MEIENKNVENMFKELQLKKENVIKEKIKSIVGLDINFESESKRKFPRILCEQQGGKETFYFNDGTVEGKRIVTFSRNKNLTKNEKNCIRLTVEYSYY